MPFGNTETSCLGAPTALKEAKLLDSIIWKCKFGVAVIPKQGEKLVLLDCANLSCKVYWKFTVKLLKTKTREDFLQ